jgi:hypothetical protein
MFFFSFFVLVEGELGVRHGEGGELGDECQEGSSNYGAGKQ